MESQKTSSTIPIILSDDGQKFLEENLNKDVNQLHLKYANNDDLKVLIDQIFIRQKIRKKVPEWYSNLRLVFTKNISHEQASSEATARLKSKLVSGQKMIDLTGGMGVDIYYFSKSFGTCTYYERQKELAAYSKHNFKELVADNIEVYCSDSLVDFQGQLSDYIYVDPARRNDDNSKLVSLSDCEPNVLKIKKKLIQGGRIALIKTSPMLDINLGIKELGNVFELWVISHRNETKELIFCLKEGEHKPLIRTFNILPKDKIETFDFHFDQGHDAILAKENGTYLYEPNSSLQKARGGDAFAKKFNLKKLDINTNLYFSDQLIENYPGKVFKVQKVLKPYDKSLKKGRFNIISRNFPDKADIIQKKMSIKSSKLEYLIACKSSFTNYIFIQASHINIS